MLLIILLLVVYASAGQCPPLCSPIQIEYCGGVQPCGADHRICCSSGTHCAILSEDEKYVCVKTEMSSKDEIIFGGVFGGAFLCCCLLSCRKCCRSDENLVIPEPPNRIMEGV